MENVLDMPDTCGIEVEIELRASELDSYLQTEMECEPTSNMPWK